MEKIGWIGTGKLGATIVRRLLTQNVPVMVFNRTSEKAQILVEDGATLASSPRAVAQECSTVFLCLTGHDAIEDVVFGSERGIVAADAEPSGLVGSESAQGTIPTAPDRRSRCIIDTSTVSPSFAISLAGRLHEIGIDYLRSDQQVFCLDGDGAFIMHMGALAIVGTQHIPNFKHIVINNGAHDSVGGQPTAGFEIDMPSIARACGYTCAARVETREELVAALDHLRASQGPALLEVRVNKGARPNLGRPTTSPIQNKESFMALLQETR